MKICRFDDDRVGVIMGDCVVDVSAIVDALPMRRWPFPCGDLLISSLPQLRPRLLELIESGSRRDLASVQLLSPVANPGKIIGIGRSYQEHVNEARQDAGVNFGRPETSPETIRMFIKANSALTGPSQGVALRFIEQRNDPEVELCVVIGRRCADISAAQALDYVAGYCIGIDMTLRGPEAPSQRKSIDTYAVLGPWLATNDEIADPGDLSITLQVNGGVRQQAHTSQLLYSVPDIIANASRYYTLDPGDVIMTGTPGGIAPVVPGDILVATVQSIGSMTVPIGRHAQ